MVPVLSRTNTSDFAIVSKKVASLKSTPRLAARLIPMRVATGVASPNAQGQAMTMTEIETTNARSNSPVIHNQPMNVKNAIERIVTEK